MKSGHERLHQNSEARRGVTGGPTEVCHCLVGGSTGEGHYTKGADP